MVDVLGVKGLQFFGDLAAGFFRLGRGFFCCELFNSFGLFVGHAALGNSDDAEHFSFSGSVLYGLGGLLQVVRNFRQ